MVTEPSVVFNKDSKDDEQARLEKIKAFAPNVLEDGNKPKMPSLRQTPEI